MWLWNVELLDVCLGCFWRREWDREMEDAPKTRSRWVVSLPQATEIWANQLSTFLTENKRWNWAVIWLSCNCTITICIISTHNWFLTSWWSFEITFTHSDLLLRPYSPISTPPGKIDLRRWGWENGLKFMRYSFTLALGSQVYIVLLVVPFIIIQGNVLLNRKTNCGTLHFKIFKSTWLPNIYKYVTWRLRSFI